VTFKDLKKRVSTLETTEEHKTLEHLSDIPFWIWNIEEHKTLKLREIAALIISLAYLPRER
jgi:hypothetical protein